MEALIIESFRDLMQHGDCTISCLYSGQQIRTLTVIGDNCHILAGDGTELDVPLDTPITYEPWLFDRGNLNFEYNAVRLKICGEGDILVANGQRYSVQPKV